MYDHSMRALRLLDDQPGHAALVDVDVPAPGPGEVLVQVHAAGVCGTDLHILDGSYPSHPPVTLGHEVAGVVQAVGPDVDPAWIGERVACETFFSTCGVCEWCRDGRPNLCPNRRSIGSGVDGGFAELMVVPARNLHRVPEGITDAGASLCEPLACACRSLLDPPRVQPADDVLVMGPGTMGLLAAQIARMCGGRATVVGTARDEVRLAAARRLGFATLDAGSVDEMRALGSGLGPHVVIECSGAGPAMATGLDVVRRGGAYVQIGQTGDVVSVPLALASFKELTITGGFASTPSSWRRAMALLAAGQIELDALVSEVTPLERWREVFDATASGAGIKFVLAPAAP